MPENDESCFRTYPLALLGDVYVLAVCRVKIWLGDATQSVRVAVQEKIKDNGITGSFHEGSGSATFQIQIVDGTGQSTIEKKIVLGIYGKTVNM